MDEFPFPIILLIVTLLLVFGFSRQRERSSLLNKAYQHLARRMGGGCRTGGLLSFPETTFAYDGSLVTVKAKPTGRKHQPHYTLLSTDWPDHRLRCEVYDNLLPASARRFLGMQDIETGDAQFDRNFCVTGSNEIDIVPMLHEGVRLAISRMRGFGRGGFHLSIQRGMLAIRVPMLITDPAQLEDFVRWGLLIRDQARLARAVGITFVEEPADEEAREIICQVCGEQIRTDMVLCRRCQTPHHRDCWYYFGACSTYGCRESRFTAGLPPPPAAPPREKRHPR